MIYLYSWCHVRFIRYPGGREKKAATQLLCSPRTHCDTFIWEYVCVKRYTPRLFPTEYGRIKNGKVCFNLFAEIFIDRYKNISVLTDNILFMNGIRTWRLSFAFLFSINCKFSCLYPSMGCLIVTLNSYKYICSQIFICIKKSED